LRADLDAGIAFPAFIGFLVVGLHFFFVQDHQVVGADVHACSFFSAFASVTFFWVHITWHRDLLAN
jgi:hypothetical protein